jgi:hypothetical protein
MKTKKLAIGLMLVALVAMMIPTVLANGQRDPGYSPGYWKHQLKVEYTGRGRAQVSWDDMEDYEAYIIANLDPTFTLEGAYLDFTDKTMNNSEDAWLIIANYFNEAAGLEPYPDDD